MLESWEFRAKCVQYSGESIKSVGGKCETPTCILIYSAPDMTRIFPYRGSWKNMVSQVLVATWSWIKYFCAGSSSVLEMRPLICEYESPTREKSFLICLSPSILSGAFKNLDRFSY